MTSSFIRKPLGFREVFVTIFVFMQCISGLGDGAPEWRLFYVFADLVNFVSVGNFAGLGP